MLLLLFIKKSSRCESLPSAVIAGITCFTEGWLATSRSRQEIKKSSILKREKKIQQIRRHVLQKSIYTHREAHRQDSANCFAPIPYSQAVAALRCSSWNKPRTQSFWGWRRSHSSFLCLLRRLCRVSSCLVATRKKKNTKKHRQKHPHTGKELRGVNPPAYIPGDCWHKNTPNAESRKLLFTEEGERENIHSINFSIFEAYSIWNYRLISGQSESTKNTNKLLADTKCQDVVLTGFRWQLCYRFHLVRSF